VNRFNRIFVIGVCVLGAALASACSDETTAPAAPDAALTEITLESPLTPPAALGFAKCTPQPTASGAAKIGPRGGTVRAGKHLLKVPAGALQQQVLITMDAPSGDLNYVVFGPEGLTFDPAHLPTLEMSYRNCAIKDHPELSLEIVYTNDAMTAVLDSTVAVAADTLNLTFGAQLKHFSKYVLKSRYAVAY
jgi:hypothetical protein